jgi:hypothetical protein
MICSVAEITNTTSTTCTNGNCCSLRNSYIVLRNYSATATATAEIRTATAACANN